MVLVPLSLLAGLFIRPNKEEGSLFLILLHIPDSFLMTFGIAKTILFDGPAGAPLEAMFVNLFIYSSPMNALYLGGFIRHGVDVSRMRARKAGSPALKL